MGKNSGIAWTDHTFNPWWGCVKVSDGCKNCYAAASSKRFGHDIWGVDKPRRFFSDKHWDEPMKWNEAATGRTLVFCASMADVFEERNDLIAPRQRLWNLIDKTRSLTWLILTKRPENIKSMTRAIPSNVWLGTTVEDNKSLWRIQQLLENPASVYFLSLEPMLEPIYLGFPVTVPDRVKNMWVIVGGESGAKCRPFEWDWARDVRDQCKDAGIPFFMKQGGGHPDKRHNMEDFPSDLRIREFPND